MGLKISVRVRHFTHLKAHLKIQLDFMEIKARIEHKIIYSVSQTIKYHIILQPQSTKFVCLLERLNCT